MDLFDNPFHILQVSPQDSRKRIIEQAEEISLSIDSEMCSKAQSDLTNPRRRLEAEVAWLPGQTGAQAKKLLELLKSSPEDAFYQEGFSALAKANYLIAALSRISDIDADRMSEWMLAIADEVECITSDDVAESINIDRQKSAFPLVSADMLDNLINERRHFFCSAIKDKLNTMPSLELVKSVTSVVEETTNVGRNSAPILIDDIVDAYEGSVQEFLAKEEQNIDNLIGQIKDSAPSIEAIDSLIAKLISTTKNWDYVAQPVQVSARSRGHSHGQSKEIARKIRGLAVWLFNEHDLLLQSKKLNELSAEVFAELDDVVEQVEEDAATLSDIERKRPWAPVDRKRWEAEITYSADIQTGWFGSTKLSITPERIIFGYEIDIRLDNIRSIAWAKLKDYEIRIIGNSGITNTITLKTQAIYEQFTQCLWKAVGLKITKAILVALLEGETLTISGTGASDSPSWGINISDRGVEMLAIKSVSYANVNNFSEILMFESKEALRRLIRFTITEEKTREVINKIFVEHTELKFLRWHEVDVWRDQFNRLVIGKKHNEKIFSFPLEKLGVRNCPIWEYLFEKIKKQRIDKLSDLIESLV